MTLAVDATGVSPETVQRGDDRLRVIGRLRPEVSPAQAHAELKALQQNIAAQFPDTNKPYTDAIVMPLLDHLVGDYRPALRVLFVAVTLVLLIACANVAGLMLARSSRRAPEMAVRSAMGAGRSAIMRQVLLESLLLSLLGGALGVLFSTWILDLLVRRTDGPTSEDDGFQCETGERKSWCSVSTIPATGSASNRERGAYAGLHSGPVPVTEMADDGQLRAVCCQHVGSETGLDAKAG